MKKKYTYLTASVLTAVTMLPTFAPSEAHAASNWNGNNSYYTRTSRRSSNRTSNRTTANRSRTSNYTVRSYGYNSYYPSYNYGYNSYYPSYNYGYGSYYPSYNYGYNNWNNYYGYDNSSNYYGYNYWNSYNNLASDENYIYWNGNHYYRMNDGSYRIYRNGQWKPLTNNSNNNSSTNNLENDPHYRYENGYHYYVLDNGDYYYYQNGKWVLVKDSADTTPAQPAQPAEPTPAQPATPAEPKPETPATPAIPTTPGLVTTDEPSENQIPDYVEKPAEGLEHLAWAPNGQTPKLVYPPGKPGDAVLKNDKNYYFDGSAHYYYVSSNSERTGYSAYWKWLGGKWKLQGMTDPNDPARDPKLHENTADDEYMYSDKNSSVKLYSTNLVTTAKAGQALPFKNVEEFKNYVIEKMNPKFLDNSGWDAKVEWEIEDPEIFEKTKENPYAKDYVLIANLKSGVEDKKYSDVEFGYVKFVYRVEATNDTNYDYVSKAKEAFAKINETRKAQGLKELTWSEDIYQNQALPKVNEISRQYDSTGFVGRRDEDAAVVVKKWANSGLRDLLLDPNVTEGAVAAVVDGNGVYYWAYSYK
ncbi:CAP domain-containing protein [Streptococcus oralis]|uniref:CAP domain-containing protein n=1 Tax=Streptococcus oralis TaxID=1303 RepID=UPI001D068A15|nr:CAP domain-containing protein [Streptococcus oralis]MCB7107510.1 CAP domain-containing protein [Streptococcus oralis]